jgi:hypothetical protein
MNLGEIRSAIAALQADLAALSGVVAAHAQDPAASLDETNHFHGTDLQKTVYNTRTGLAEMETRFERLRRNVEAGVGR